MAHYRVIYNPYSNETRIEKNGELLPQTNHLCVGVDGKRLQSWFDKDLDWKGFAQELDENNSEKECSIFFEGREIDYIDFKEYFDDYTKNNSDTVFIFDKFCYQNDTDMLENLLNLIERIKDQGILSTKQVEEIENKIKSLKEDPFAISVLATMSSGKSTLLNAFLKTNLLPMGNRPTTANIVEIFDNDKTGFELETYDGNNELIEKMSANPEVIRNINNDKNISRVKIYGDIPFVQVGKMGLMLRDTPGPNSQIEEHERITNSIIADANNQSAVIYVMDTTKPTERSDGDLLKSIADEMRKGDRLTSDRFFFVINKADDWVAGNDNNNQTMDNLIAENREYLKEFGINNPRLFPVTANLALNIRRVIENENVFEKGAIKRNFNNSVDNFSLEDDSEYSFDCFASVSYSVKQQIEKELLAAREREDRYTIALIHTGIPSLEYSIREYMDKYAYPIKISDAVKDIRNYVDENKMLELFKELIEKDEGKLNNIISQKEKLESDKGERQKKKEEILEKIDAYTIPKSIIEKANRDVDDKFRITIDCALSELSMSKIEKNKANQIIDTLEKEVRKKEREIEKEINDVLNEQIYIKAGDAVEEYRNYLSELQGSLVVEGFDFTKIKSLKDCGFGDIRRDANRVSDVEYEYEKRPIPGKTKHLIDIHHKVKIPFIKKHIHIDISLFKYKEEDKEELVRTDKIIAEHVDTKDIRDDILSITKSVQQNISSIFDFANDELTRFKDHFRKELEKLQLIIDDTINQISELTQSRSAVDIEKQDHEGKLNELESIIKELDSIVSIKGGV